MGDIAYNFTDDVMAYFRYAQGYKSGGFDQRFAGQTPSGLPSSFDSETTDTYEIGLKSEWFDNTLRLNLAVFHTDYDDVQVIVRETFNPLTFNAGEADIDGGELEITWVPLDALADHRIGWAISMLSTTASASQHRPAACRRATTWSTRRSGAPP